jgi:hypothetical protein
VTDDESQAPDDLQVKVEKWLEVSGHALEMRVARTFQKVSPAVTQGRHYRDGEALREVDVVVEVGARRINGPLWTMNFVVECKNAADKPWVVFTRRNEFADNPLLDRTIYLPAVRDALESVTERQGYSTSPLDFATEVVGYMVADALLDAKTSSESRNTAYNAVRQVLSGCYGLLPELSTDGPAMVIPVIVTKAPLFEASLLRDGSVSTTRVDSSSVLAPTEEQGREVAVFLMNEEYLNSTFAPALPDLQQQMRYGY